MTRTLTHLQIETGPGGWAKVFWRRSGESELSAFVRFRPPRRKGEPWTLIGLQAPKDSRLHTFLLNDVPRHLIEQAINASAVFQEGLRADFDKPATNDLDGAFRGKYREAPRLKLERPGRRNFDDAFLRDVATAYRQAIAAGLPPLRTMADDSGIPQGTIARWVGKAREPERGFLPPAEPGKVST
jgi:hypothetical protein